MSQVVVCVDIGTTRIKSAALDDCGNTVAEVSADTPAPASWNGFVTFDAKACLNAVVELLANLSRRLVAKNHTVLALTLTNQRATLVPLDREQQALGPAISWQDTSCAAAVDSLIECVGRKRFTDTTGLPPSPLWSLVKILHLRRQFPDVFGGVGQFVFLGDYLLLCFGAEKPVTDASNASVSGILDIRTRNWSREILSACGVRESLLPEVVATGTVCGRLSDEVASRTGLPSGLPLVVGAGDQQCSALAVGAVEEGDAGLCLGTAAILSCCSSTPRPELAGQFFCTAHALPRTWVLEGIHNAFLSSLNWLGTVLGVTDAHQRWDLVRSVPPGANGLLFFPFLAGIGSPDFDGAAAGTFTGLRNAHTSADLMCAAMEGVIFETRRMLDRIPDEIQIRRLVISGGFTTNGTDQMLADALGREIAISPVSESTLRGASAIAWAALGRFDSIAQAARSITNSTIKTLVPTSPSSYDSIYEKYAASVDRVRALYELKSPVV